MFTGSVVSDRTRSWKRHELLHPERGPDEPRSPSPTSDTSRRARWLALYVLCLGDLMIVLDQSIVNVALPSIRDDLGFSQSSLAWVVNAYLLTFGGFLLLSGRLGDLLGNKRVFLGGTAFFTVASIACGLAPSSTLLVVGRAVQGLGGAAVSAVALSLIMGLFTEPAERAKAMGVFGFVMSGGGAVGVLLGGVLTGAVVLALDLPGQRADRPRRPARRSRDPARRRRRARQRQARRPRRGPGDRRADARRLRDRRRQRGRLDLRPHARPARSRAPCCSQRSSGWESRAAAPLVPLRLFTLRNLVVSQIVGILWAAAMFAWFFLAALYLAGRARLRRVRGRSGLHPDQRGDGVLLAAGLRPAGHEVRHPSPAGRRTDAGRHSAWRCSPSRSVDGDFVVHVLPVDDPARHRRRHRSSTRSCSPRWATSSRTSPDSPRRRQHRLHDGRRARPRRPGRGLRLAPRLAARARAWTRSPP